MARNFHRIRFTYLVSVLLIQRYQESAVFCEDHLPEGVFDLDFVIGVGGLRMALQVTQLRQGLELVGKRVFDYS